VVGQTGERTTRVERIPTGTPNGQTNIYQDAPCPHQEEMAMETERQWLVAPTSDRYITYYTPQRGMRFPRDAGPIDHRAPVPSAHGRIANSDLCINSVWKTRRQQPCRYRHLHSGWKSHDTHTCPPTHDPQLPGIHVYMARRPPTNKNPGRGTQASC
jgi:hypothetical protein